MPEANGGPAQRDGETDMTPTETTRYAIPRDTIENSRRRARRLRTRVVLHLLRRTMRRLNAMRPQAARTALRPAVQCA
jgi:hypothetical protein